MSIIDDLILFILLTVIILIVLYHYRRGIVDSMIKSKAGLRESTNGNSMGRLPEFFTLGLGVLIGCLIVVILN